MNQTSKISDKQLPGADMHVREFPRFACGVLRCEALSFLVILCMLCVELAKAGQQYSMPVALSASQRGVTLLPKRSCARRRARASRCCCCQLEAARDIQYNDTWTDIAFIALCRKVSIQLCWRAQVVLRLTPATGTLRLCPRPVVCDTQQLQAPALLWARGWL